MEQRNHGMHERNVLLGAPAPGQKWGESNSTSLPKPIAVWRGNSLSECENWNRFLNAYGRVQWRGERWASSSRLLIELFYPIHLTQDRVIAICTPPRSVAWINHVFGYTPEQWVLFDPYSGGKTRVSIWIEIVGKSLCVEGPGIRKVIQDFVVR